MIKIEDVEKALKKASFAKLFTTPYSVNLFGIRSEEDSPNDYNDYLGAFFYYPDGCIKGVIIKGTTDAGKPYRIKPINKKGTVIVKHNHQHRGAYQFQDTIKNTSLRGHRGKTAFRQVREMLYWRDNNKDLILDFEGDLESGIAYTNIHTMGNMESGIEKWSAGCQGSSTSELRKLFKIAETQIENGLGDTFSYTLFHETTFNKLIN